MKQNESKMDRIIRLLVGGILLILGLFVVVDPTLRIVLDVLGILGLFTGATGFCLLYKLFGISTKKD